MEAYAIAKYYHLFAGYPQTTYQGFQYNGESDLDLEYGMSLVTAKQNVTLYQVGDLVEGRTTLCISFELPHERCGAGASFNNFLDALDGRYCTFEGGDDHSQDGTYPDPLPGGYKGMHPVFELLIFISRLERP